MLITISRKGNCTFMIVQDDRPKIRNVFQQLKFYIDQSLFPVFMPYITIIDVGVVISYLVIIILGKEEVRR